MNPDKTEFIIFGVKRRRDKLKACFPIDILGRSSLPCWVSQESGGVVFRIFPCLSIFRMSAKAVLCNCVISDMSGSFLLMMLLYLWLMLLLVVGLITVTHYSGVFPSSIYVNYSASKIVQPELYQIPEDTPV